MESILWRRLDRPGHDLARLLRQSLPTVTGTAIFADESLPCQLNYSVACDAAWQTTAAEITGWIGGETIHLDIAVETNHNDRRWSVNGTHYPQVDGCIDFDLNVSPATNLLSIRRLQLAIGEQAHVTAAWLQFPKFTLEPLPQLYRRVAERTYHYESGDYVAQLAVNPAGFVTNYPGLWTAEPLLRP